MMAAVDYRDPLYGFITLDELENRVVDLAPFQRLRRIRQLGPTSLVYPSGDHTRFEHALGTLQASTEMFDRLVTPRQARELLGWDDQTIALNRKLMRLAALLHDVGHAPFSHATEELFPNGAKHEDYTFRIITETEIGSTIDSELGDGSVQRVAEIAIGKARAASDVFLSELLTGDIGTDRIDYLIRDSHHLGVAYGRFDYHRLFNTLFIRDSRDSRDSREKQGPDLAIEDGGLHSVEGFLLARYFMFLDVYFHKTRRILDLHLTEFMRSWLPGGLFPADVNKFVELDDADVVQALKQNNTDVSRRVFARQFYRLAFETVDHPDSAQLVAFKWLVEQVQAQYPAENIRIDEAEKDPYKYSAPPLFVLIGEGPSKYRSITDRSTLISSLKIIRKKRIYALESIRREVSEFCREKWASNLQGIVR